MGKRLTEKEKRVKEVSRIVLKIKKLEQFHNQDVVESACVKYKNANVDKRKATDEIINMEEKLADAKRRLR